MTFPSPAMAGQLLASLDAARQSEGVPSLLSPMTARLPAALADLAYSLPIGDANGELLEALRVTGAFPEHTFAGVLANDPFRLADDLLEMLSQRGCRRVANWPSAALLGGSLSEALRHSGLGYAEEMAFLARARRQGFHTLAVICREQQLDSVLAANPTKLLVAVELEAAEAPPNKTCEDLLALVEEIRTAGHSPWLYEHVGVETLTAALHAKVEGVIRHPGQV